jgi:methylglutamate dehydrogenase subunit D
VSDLSARSGLENILARKMPHGAPGVMGIVLALREDLALASVMARAGRITKLVRSCREKFDIELPLSPKRRRNGPVSLTWSGPGQWLAAMEGETPEAFEDKLRNAFEALASVSNQSDARTILRVRGPKSRQMLAKMIPLDLDPRSFPPGGAALTIASHINVHFWLLDESPAFEFAVFRSLAVAFVDQLTEASDEFGWAIE